MQTAWNGTLKTLCVTTFFIFGMGCGRSLLELGLEEVSATDAAIIRDARVSDASTADARTDTGSSLCIQDQDCDNHIFCDGQERCLSGTGCVAGTPIACGACQQCDEVKRICVDTELDACNCGVEISCENGMDDNCNGLADCADPQCSSGPNCIIDAGQIDTGVVLDSGRPMDSGSFMDSGFLRDGASIDAGSPIDAGSAPDVFAIDAGTPRDSGVIDAGMCTVSELGPLMCTDGIDNNCNGRADCRDFDCAPFGTLGECCDGTDDNGDGFVDIFTCRCSTSSDCASIGNIPQTCWAETLGVCAPRCDRFGGDAFCARVSPLLTCVRFGPQRGECVFR